MPDECCCCCCCCYCCILPAIFVPLFVTGTLDGQAAVAAVTSSFQNAADDVATALGRLEVSEIPNVAGEQRTFSICGDSTTIIYDGMDMSTTNAIRCEKNTIKTWSKWIVRVTELEFMFNGMAELNYYTSISALICGAIQVALAFFTSFCCNRSRAKTRSLAILELVFTSYFGLIYSGYLVTIPLFGWPEKGIFFPELPHVGPPRPLTGVFTDKVVYAIRNSIFLAFVLYVLMMSVVLFSGILLAIPPICFFMAILFFSMGRLNALVAQIRFQVCIRMKEEDDTERMMLLQRKGPITVPWWDGYTQDRFEHMGFPTDTLAKTLALATARKCSLESSSPDWRSLCRKIFSFFTEILKMLAAVGLPSFLRFIFDIFFLLTALGSFSLVVPALTFELPDLGMSQLRPTYVPEWQGHCRATTGLGLTLNLIGSTFFVSVLISSDILTYFCDRLSRWKLLRTALRQLLDARYLPHPSVAFSFLCGLAQAFLQLPAFAALFCIALTVNQAAVILLRLVLEMGAPNSDDGNIPEGYPPCTVGLFALSKILGLIAIMVTLIYACRVLSGHVHKEGTYGLGAATVFCRWPPTCRQRLKLFMAMVRVCSFTLLLPFFNSGLEERHRNRIQDDLKQMRGHLDSAFEHYDISTVHSLQSWLVKKVKDVTKPIRLEETNLEHVGLMRFVKLLQRAVDLTGNRHVRSALISSLFVRASDFYDDEISLQRDVGQVFDLRDRDDFYLFDYTRCCSKMEEERSKRCHSFLAIMGAPIGRMTNSDAIANHMAERCCMRQAQAESVQRATAYVQGLVLFLIPVGGAIAGKGLQLLSDVPGLFTAETEEICQYSFCQEPNPLNPKKPRIVASGWCMAAFACAILRFMCLFLIIAHSKRDVFWPIAVANSVLAIAQDLLARIDDRENKCKIARFLHDREKLQESSPLQDSSSVQENSPSPETIGVRISDGGGDLDHAGESQPANASQPEEDEKEEEEQEQAALLKSDGEHDMEEEEPVFQFQSDEENPSSPTQNKGKKKSKKSQSKAKSKAKSKARASRSP